MGPNGATLWESVPGPYGDWGRREHTVYVDSTDHVWVSNDESQVLYKFTRAGRHVLTIGDRGVTAGSNDRNRLGRPAGLVLDSGTNELFVADGYTNKRVIVFDATTVDGRTVRLENCNVYHFRDGKFAAVKVYGDSVEIPRQFGLS
mgnify:CR=1 FL=1